MVEWPDEYFSKEPRWWFKVNGVVCVVDDMKIQPDDEQPGKLNVLVAAYDPVEDITYNIDFVMDPTEEDPTIPEPLRQVVDKWRESGET